MKKVLYISKCLLSLYLFYHKEIIRTFFRAIIYIYIYNILYIYAHATYGDAYGESYVGRKRDKLQLLEINEFSWNDPID